MNNKCFYLVEGACERQLINALKAEPAILIPGSIIVHNVVQKTIPKAYVASFGRNSFVTMVFDTDIPQTDTDSKSLYSTNVPESKLSG